MKIFRFRCVVITREDLCPIPFTNQGRCLPGFFMFDCQTCSKPPFWSLFVKRHGHYISLVFPHGSSMYHKSLAKKQWQIDSQTFCFRASFFRATTVQHVQLPKSEKVVLRIAQFSGIIIEPWIDWGKLSLKRSFWVEIPVENYNPVLAIR